MEDSRQDDEPSLEELIGQVYLDVPLPYRGQMVEHLLRPLGLLAIAGVANGLFAKLACKNGGFNLKIPQEDIASIEAQHVVALAHRVQQVSIGSIENLGQVLLSSPVIAGSAAAAMLISVLARRAGRQSAVRLDSDD